MRFVRSFFKSLLVFAFGIVAAAFVTMTAVSYYAVEHLTLAKPVDKVAEHKKVNHKKKSAKSTEPDGDLPPEDSLINSNILDVFRLGDQYTAELNQFDELTLKLGTHKAPKLCDVICNESTFDRGRMLDERTPYLLEFYKENAANSLKDPYFQLKLKEIGFLSEVFPSALRAVWLDVEEQRNTNPTFSQKLNWAFRFEVVALKELSKLYSRREVLLNETDRIQSWRDLISSCQKGLKPAKDLRAQCEQI
jgi:hypothetical protein